MDEASLIVKLRELLEVVSDQPLEQLPVGGYVLVQAEAPLVSPDRSLARDAIERADEMQARPDALTWAVESESDTVNFATITSEQGARSPVGALARETLVKQAALQLLGRIGGCGASPGPVLVHLRQNGT